MHDLQISCIKYLILCKSTIFVDHSCNVDLSLVNDHTKGGMRV